jgi:hypothetical protein
MDLKLSDEQLYSMVAEALFSKLDQETVQKMVTEALAALMTPKKDDYGRLKSPGRLQEAVEDALLRVARKVCEEEFAKTEVQEKVSAMVKEAINKTMVTERDRAVNAMASSFRSALYSLDEKR